MSKNILISPYYIETNGVGRMAVSHTFGDLIHDYGFTPIDPLYGTEVHSLQKGLDIAKKYIDFANALLLIGGSDINPKLYNQENYHSEMCTDFRDYFEFELTKLALQKNIPIMGVCRGMQILNIVYGGNLDQNLDIGQFQKHNFGKIEQANQPVLTTLSNHHTIRLNKSGLLYNKFKTETIEVNSFHHQGINILGANLLEEAYSSDGLIEAISDKKNKVFGVQWHPETSFSNTQNRNVFEIWFELFSN